MILHKCPDRPDKSDSPSYQRMPLYQRINRPQTPHQPEVNPFEGDMFSDNADCLCSESQDADAEELMGLLEIFCYVSRWIVGRV